jgi:hypothetical protein
MFGWFSHLVDSLFASIHPCVWVKSSPILCRNVFHFLDFWRYFWPDFCSCNLKSLSSISSMGKVARMSLNMCPQSWGNQMALAPSIWRFCEFISNLYIPCVEVTLVSKCHPFWWLIAQEWKLWRKTWIFGKFSVWTGQVRWTFSAGTFDDCFERYLVTVSPINPILLLLAS